jgi:hypothetical protein
MNWCAARADFGGGFRPPTPGGIALSRGLILGAGSRPARGLLFFVRPKKTNEKKGRPIAAPCGFPARLARIGARLRAILTRRRGQAIHGLSPAGLIRFGLRCSARQTGGKGGKSKDKIKTAPLPVGCAPRTIPHAMPHATKHASQPC